MAPIAAYLLLFVAVGAGFILVHLLAGKLIRPSKPGGEKDTIYECGEPTIGSAWIQFDLRFYVVALLFVVFDVEVAFFFPWAEVFGKANAVVNAPEPQDVESAHAFAEKVLDLSWPHEQTREVIGKGGAKEVVKFDPARRYREVLASNDPDEIKKLLSSTDVKRDKEAASDLSWAALVEVLLFFGILLVGFAYLWKRGDLAWVRSLQDRAQAPPAPLTRGPGGNGPGVVLVEKVVVVVSESAGSGA
jgi:NADH-quinone oxidoreductase subunit A